MDEIADDLEQWFIPKFFLKFIFFYKKLFYVGLEVDGEEA